MEANYYSKETYLQLKKESHKWLILSISSFVFGLLFFGLSALYINVKTVLAVTIIDAIILSASLIAGFYILLDIYIPKIRRNKFVYRLLTVERFVGQIKVTKIKEPYLVRKYIEAYEIEALDEDNKVLICYLESVHQLDFEVGDVINVTLSASFIVDIGEKTNE